jgi:hypothetical protein
LAFLGLSGGLLDARLSGLRRAERGQSLCRLDRQTIAERLEEFGEDCMGCTHEPILARGTGLPHSDVRPFARELILALSDAAFFGSSRDGSGPCGLRRADLTWKLPG